MATVNVNFFRPAIVEDAYSAVMGVSDNLNYVFTSSGSSQATAAGASLDRNYVRVVATGGNVWLAFGLNPTAVTSTGHLLIAGIPEVFYVENGFKVALID